MYIKINERKKMKRKIVRKVKNWKLENPIWGSMKLKNVLLKWNIGKLW
jgi:hypothetical protein